MNAESKEAQAPPTEVVIPREKATFWLDANGCWHNASGKFRHKKIIDFFHAAIRKDAGGYFLFQNRGDCIEKVYFNFEDTALFVFDVLTAGEVILVLNTGKKLPLDPQKLFVKNDSLYVTTDGDHAKFAERSLMKIAGLMEFENEAYYLRLGRRRHRLDKH